VTLLPFVLLGTLVVGVTFGRMLANLAD